MSHPFRDIAESRIRSGAVPSGAASTLSPKALELLHRLATAEDTANDALRLLHELRVHQVELDMQLEQAQENEQELAQELAVYRDFWQLAPAGCFSVSLDGNIIQANRAGAELFGVDAAELPGRPIGDIVAADFRPMIQAMLDQLRDGGPKATCEARSNGHDGSYMPLQIVAGRSPGSESCLVHILNSGQAESPDTSR